jgi:hypothetical protein
MAGYELESIGELARQLLLGPSRVRRRQADRLEGLLLQLDQMRSYPYEFVYYRITGYRPKRPPQEVYDGNALYRDLRLALRELSAGAPGQASEADERVLGLETLADELNVSARTIRRWEARGLVAAVWQFPDGGARLGVRQSALERFAERHPGLPEAASRFSRLSRAEERRALALAAGLARDGGLSRTAAAQRIARELGRAPETVRRFLLRHDREQPGGALFGRAAGRGGAAQHAQIAADYRAGAPVAELAVRYGRSRSSIYRLINRHRAQALLKDLPPFYSEASFEEPGADEELIGPPLDELTARLRAQLAAAEAQRPGAASLTATTAVPLAAPEEKALFRGGNYARFRAAELRRQLDQRRYVPSSLLRQIESLDGRAERLRELLVRLYEPLADRVARQHAGTGAPLPDLMAHARAELSHLVDSFDYRVRARFSSYAQLELLKAFARAR